MRTVVSLTDGRSATIHYLRPVGLYGLPTVFFPIPFGVHVVKRAAVVEFDAATLIRAGHEHSKLAWFVSQQPAGALLRVPSIIEEFGFKSVRQRIASHLIALSEQDGTTGGRTAHVTQTRLAEHVGTAREVVWRCLRSLGSDGLVIVRPGSIGITDEAALRRVAHPLTTSSSGR